MLVLLLVFVILATFTKPTPPTNTDRFLSNFQAGYIVGSTTNGVYRFGKFLPEVAFLGQKIQKCNFALPSKL